MFHTLFHFKNPSVICPHRNCAYFHTITTGSLILSMLFFTAVYPTVGIPLLGMLLVFMLLVTAAARRGQKRREDRNTLIPRRDRHDFATTYLAILREARFPGLPPEDDQVVIDTEHPVTGAALYRLRPRWATAAAAWDFVMMLGAFLLLASSVDGAAQDTLPTNADLRAELDLLTTSDLIYMITGFIAFYAVGAVLHAMATRRIDLVPLPPKETHADIPAEPAA